MWDFPAIDPVLLDIPGPLDVRWYGLMYVVAFVCAQFIMARLQKAGFFKVEKEQVGDLIFYTVIGTIVGGRTGYALFYQQSLLNPVEFFQVWQGGLSFHGGLLGVAVAFWLFARKHSLPITRVGDICALAVTPGIFAVRMANFINGELYGRVTDKATWGSMQFPTDPAALHELGIADLPKRPLELGIQYAYGKVEWDDVKGSFGPTADALKERLNWDAVRESVPYRHPSQLYEGFGEGLLVGLVLFVCYFLTRKKPWANGMYGGVFLIGYGAVRYAVEFLRQPDAQFRDADDPVGTVFLGMTMGQVLCAAMILAGAYLVFGPKRRDAASDEVVADAAE